MITITGRARVRPDRRDVAISAARDMRQQTIDEPGCIDYRFWSATDDPNAILLFEQWEERSALETHLAAPHLASFLAEIGPAIDGGLEVTRFEVSDHGPLLG
jgi:quinol monooxygenase YgiN